MVASFIQPCSSIVTRLTASTSTSTLFLCAFRRIPLTRASTFFSTPQFQRMPNNVTSAIRMTSTTPPPASSPTPPSSEASSEPTMARAKHILLDSEELLDTIKEEIEQGTKDFSDIAKLVSKCPSKDRGGDLGWFRRNVMVKDFEKAAFSNPPGSLVKVQTEFGWHLIKIEDHATASTGISVQEFAVRFVHEKQNAQFIDCREINELKLAKINQPEFLHLPMAEYDKWVEDFESGKLNLQKDKETIVMCHHGMRSANFCSFLSQQGFKNVRNLDGGIHAFATEIDSSVPTYGN